jgi:hypothetical protein
MASAPKPLLQLHPDDDAYRNSVEGAEEEPWDNIMLRDDMTEAAAPPLTKDSPGQSLVAEQRAPKCDT